MRINGNINEIMESGNSSMLPAGGYVAIITNVEDVPGKEYIRCTYDIAEGEYTGFFATDDRDYTHQFVRSYTVKALPFFKAFLNRLQESNQRFDVAAWSRMMNEKELIGLRIGIVVQETAYTNQSGEDRKRMDVELFYNCDDIRSGNYKMPEPKDKRQKAAPAPAVTGIIEDVPF